MERAVATAPEPDGLEHRHRQQRGIRPQLAHQHGGAAVDEAFGEPGVERVGQPRLDRAGAFGHFLARGDPVGPLGNVGPAADCG